MALCAGVLLSPRPSEAGCGDYVRIRGRLAPMAHAMPDQPMSAEGTPVDAANHGSPLRPCHGPGCSDDSSPRQAPVPVVVVSIDRWAVAPDDALPNSVCCDDMLAEPVDFVADAFRLSILRPPR